MQHRGAFIERDDGVVRQLVFTLAAGSQIGELNLEFAVALRESPCGSEMPAYTEAIRLAQALELIGFLMARTIIETAHESARVDRGDAPASRARRKARR